MLRGGIEAWRAAGGVTVDAALVPADGSRWVLGLEPEVEALAAAWLLRRFIDPAAVFFQVEAEQVAAAGEELQATPLGTDSFAGLCAKAGLDVSALPDLVAALWPGQLALAGGPQEALGGGFALLDAAYAAGRRP